jgi:SET domain-containing protein
MRRKKILNQLEKDVYCGLMPSKIEGVGVFAVRDIPRGTNPFKEKNTKYISIKEQQLKKLDINVMEHIKKLFVHSDGRYWLPKHGIQTLYITHYLNHSKNPNLTTTKNADYFLSIRDIKKGEELTVNYNLFDDLKEDFRKG